MVQVEGVLLWVAVAGYAIAFAGLTAAVFFAKRWQTVLGRVAGFGAFGAHSAAILVRWIATGHAPVQGAYEHALAGAWFLPAVGLLALYWHRPVAKAAPAVIGLTLLVLGDGVMAPATLAPLEPAYKSNWLVVHVVFAWLAFGSYLVASLLAVWYLWRFRRRVADEETRAALLDETTAKLVAFGFVSHTVMIGSGAIWAHGLWGRYWGWDPIETWSLVTWLLYAIYLHLRFALGWTGRRAVWLVIGAAVAIALTFFGIGMVSNVHTGLL